MQTYDISQSIELAVTQGSVADAACAVMAHPYSIFVPAELLEQISEIRASLSPEDAKSLWELVRFVSSTEIAASGGAR